MKHLKLFFALFAMLALGVGNAWGANYEIVAKKGSGDGSSLSTSTKVTDVFSNGTYVAKFTTASKSYYNGSNGLKLGASSSAGDLKFTLTDGGKVKATTIIVSAKRYNTSKSVTLQVIAGGVTCTAQTISNSSNFTDYTYTINANITDIQLKTSKYCWVESITINYEDGGSEEPVPSLTLDPTSKDFATVMVGEEASQEFTITPKNTTATLSAIISDEINYAISGIENNKITVTYKPQSAADKHDAVLTVKAGDEASATVTLSGKAVAALEGTWALVTDASSLKAGDKIIIAAKDYDVALGTTQANNNRPEVAIKKNGNTITATSEAQVLTLQAGNQANTLALYTGSGYLYAASSSSNYLRTETTLSDNSSWVISIADGTATLTAQGEFTRNTMFYNLSSKIFACYASTTTDQKAIALYKKVDESEVLAPGFTPTGGTFYGAQSVEITCATAGAEIYYTLDGSAPTSSSTKYTTAISISETKTLKAIAIKGENSSSVTEATYTILAPLATMQEIFDKATAVGGTATPVKVAMNNWVVTGVKGSNAYLTDGTKGLIIYNASHGFVAGDVLSGTVACKVQLYNGSSELTDLTKTTEGLSVTTGGTVTPVEVSDVTTLSGVNTGAVVKITGTCTQESSKYYVAGVQLYNSLFTYTNPTVGKKYNVTGVYLQYNTTQEILPRQQEDIEEVVDALPSATISIANITMEVGEEKTIEATITPVDAPITYETTATCITLNGTTITAVSEGTATITATIAGKDGEYTGATKTFTVTVKPVNIATLPFTFDGKQADIANTLGMSHTGVDASDYSSSPHLKFNHAGDNLIVHFDSQAGEFSFVLKQNGSNAGTFTVYESANGEDYTPVWTGGDLGGNGQSKTITPTLAAVSRYVKFEYTTKGTSTNYGLGNIKIALPSEEPEQPGGGETPGERLTDWVLTPLADITTNDLVVITMTKGETTWAMTNDKGTSAAPVASVVTLSADALAVEPDANLKWVVSNNNGTLTIYPYGTYETWLYCTNTNNGVRVGTGDAKEFTIDTDHLYTTLTNDPRYLGVYDADADTWRCYTSINSNIEGQTLAFYVKKNANDVLPGTGEDPEEPGDDPVVPTPTVNPTATFIFNTAEGLDDLGIIYPATADEDTEGAYKTEFVDNATYTQDGITMTTTKGTSIPTRVWLTKAGKLDLRIYNGASLTLSVGDNLVISNVVFTGKNITNLKVDNVAVSNNSWTGNKQSVTFDVTATTNIYTIAITVSYTRSISADYGTICLPYGSSNYSGAEFYEFVGKETGKVWLASVDKLEAGVPYVFKVKGTQLTVAYEGTPVSDPGNHNGLYGTFTDNTPVAPGHYIISQGKVLAPCGTGCYVNANRAYVVMENIKGDKPTQQIPGRKYIGMDVQGENEATGVEDLFTTDAPVKVIENGQLIIIRDGVKYNVQGQKL